jgi:hypothetical protein
VIDIAPGAESLPLALQLADVVRRNVSRDAGKRTDFDGLRGSVAVVADDHGTALTLRFDFGRMVVHTGVVGVPDITLLGPLAVLEELGERPSRGLLGLAWGELRRKRPEDDAAGGGGGGASGTERSGRRGGLKIYGLWTHPLLVRRLLSVMSG